MRNAKELVRATKPFAREIRWRSWWSLFSTLGLLALMIYITCLNIAWYLRLPASIVSGLTMVRLFVVYHDYQHGTILRNSFLAKAILEVCGLLMLTPRSIWRHSHNYHHTRNSRLHATGIGSFEVMTTLAFSRASWTRRFTYSMSRHPLIILMGYLTVFLFGMCLYPVVRRPKKHADCGLAFLLHVSIVTALAIFAPAMLFWTLLLPMIIGTLLGSYLFYAQHNFPEARFQDGNSFDFVNAALTSSSFIPMNPVMRWFTGNIGYHHVHHLNAHIPFYRLPEAMARLPELQSPRVTYLWPLAIYRCLRLKLWDPEKQRLVPFAAAKI